MKLFSEKMCEMYSSKINNPMETIVIRPGNLYGPFDKYTTKESKVIAALIRRFAERQNPIEVWGDGNDIKDFLYIDDFINGLLKSFTINNLANPVNIASSVPSTIKDVINCLKIISNSKDVNILFDCSKPTMIPKRLISTSLAKQLFDWKPKTNLESGLTKTYEWYLSYYKLNSPEEVNFSRTL